ncbi:MAG: hypothetical protein KGY56_06425 [Desulfobacterales bacterium]|nr:hypothetical protein [Desulfobacterales bacterium]
MPPACESGANSIFYFMMEEGMNFLGSVKIRGNIPCIRCGYGDECQMAGVKMIFGPEATLDTVGINKFETQAETEKAARDLGTGLAAALTKQG